MNLDSEYLSLVLSGVVQSVTSDQILIEHALSDPSGKASPSLVLRNKYNTDLLNRIVFIGINIAAASSQAVSLLDCFEQTLKQFDSRQIAVRIERDKPLLDVLSDPKILVSIIGMVICLLKLENTSLKKIGVGLRRRGGYVSIRFTAGKVRTQLNYQKDLIDFINHILSYNGSRLSWSQKSLSRTAYLRLRLSNQMPLSYNEYNE